MDNRNSYFISGLFFCVVSCVLVVFLLFMGKGEKNQKYTEYLIQTSELPSGVKNGVSVKFIGVDVGYVADVRFSKQSLEVIEIVLKVREGIPIRPNSSASVEQNAITGISVININNDGVGEFASGEVKMVRLEKSLFKRIGTHFADISERISHSLAQIEAYLNPQRMEQIDNIVKSVSLISQNLAKADFAGLVRELNERTKRGEFDFKAMLSMPLQDISDAATKLQEAVDIFSATMIRLEDNPYEFFFKDTSR